MVRAGIEAGLSEENARLVAAQVVLGTASLVKHTHLPFADLKALTPMETLIEAQLSEQFYQAAVGVKNKIDALQGKIVTAWPDHPRNCIVKLKIKPGRQT